MYRHGRSKEGHPKNSDHAKNHTNDCKKGSADRRLRLCMFALNPLHEPLSRQLLYNPQADQKRYMYESARLREQQHLSFTHEVFAT